MNMTEKLKLLVAKNASIDIEAEEISDETKLLDELEYDSVKIVELIVDIEEEFDFEFEDDDLVIEKYEIFKNLNSLVERRIAENTEMNK